MKLKRWFFGGRKIQDEIKKRSFFELLRNMCFTYSFDQTSFLFHKNKFVSRSPFWQFFVFWKNKCVRIFFSVKKRLIIIRFFSVLRKSFSNIFCWNFFAEGGERNPLENPSQFVLYPLMFWKKKSFSIFFTNVLFFLFLFRFVFSFLLFSFLLLCLTFFKKKKKNRIKWETAWCNGCPADQIRDNWTHIDFTSSTTSPHAAVIKRAFNRASNLRRSKKFLEIKNMFSDSLKKMSETFFHLCWTKAFSKVTFLFEMNGQ